MEVKFYVILEGGNVKGYKKLGRTIHLTIIRKKNGGQWCQERIISSDPSGQA